jgi:hypothetical protein
MNARATLSNSKTNKQGCSGIVAVRVVQDNFDVVYWKFENVYEVQRQWKHEFAMEPLT